MLVTQFWDGLERIFALEPKGQEDEARTLVLVVAAGSGRKLLSNAVARLLVQNNESEQAAAEETQRIYAGAKSEMPTCFWRRC